MIINNSRQFIYIHIPKCGGTSISSFLERKLLPQDITLNLSPHEGWDKYLDAVQKKFGLHKHSTAEQISKAMGREFFKQYYVFTFCRNPFARAYSIFNFTKRADAKHRPNSKRYKDIKDMSFEEFLDSKYVRERQVFASRLQSDWIKNSPVEVEGYKLEEVDQMMVKLSQRIYGEKIDTMNMPRKNSSTSKNDWMSMSQEAEKLVLSLFAEDFVTFNYPTQVPRE